MEPKYGSVAWFEKEYKKVADDPWGLSWRPSQALRYRRMLDVIERHAVNIPKSSFVMDYGCAIGDFTAALTRQFEQCDWNIIGVDFSPSAILRARERFPNQSFESWTLDELKRKFPGSVNVLICLEVIYYLKPEQRVEMLDVFNDLLSPGGYVLISSMKAKPPYLTAEELRQLVGRRFDIVEYGSVYAKPLSLVEKIGVKLEKFLGTTSATAAKLRVNTGGFWTPTRTDRWESRWRKWLGKRAISHVYVLGKKK